MSYTKQRTCLTRTPITIKNGKDGIYLITHNVQFNATVSFSSLGLFLRHWLLRFVALTRLRSRLEQDIISHLRRWYPAVNHMYFFHSGRGGLLAVLRHIAHAAAPEGRVVLVPEYLCNLVHRVVYESGLEYRSYPLNSRFEPDTECIDQQLAAGNIKAVVFASIFGARNASERWLQQVRSVSPDIWVIWDECQSLTTCRPSPLDDRCAIVWSFNGKTVPGIMGGLVGSAKRFQGLQPRVRPGKRKDTFREFYVAAMAVAAAKRGLRRLLFRRFALPKLEYAACEAFPYTIDVAPITRVSLAWAWAGMSLLKAFEGQRQRIYQLLREQLAEVNDLAVLCETEDASLSAFIPLRLQDSIGKTGVWPLKGPYAKEEAPEETLHPRLLCYHNEGFWQPRLDRNPFCR